MSISEMRKRKNAYMKKWRKQSPEREAKNKILSLCRFLKKISVPKDFLKGLVEAIKKILEG
jgi:hypothetical protein